MIHRILHSYPARLVFLALAGIVAGAIIGTQFLLSIPGGIRRFLN